MNCPRCNEALMTVSRDRWTTDFHCFKCGRSWAEHVGIDDFPSGITRENIVEFMCQPGGMLDRKIGERLGDVYRE